MSLSDEFKKIKEKYEPKEMTIILTKCSNCRHPETKYCLLCGDCGREFEYGKLVKESEESQT